jgi:HSP20 family protein
MSDSEENFFELMARGINTENGDIRSSSRQNRENDKKEDKKNSEEKMNQKETNENSADTEGKLTIDVYQTPTEIVVESAIAGIKPEDLDINVSGDSITINGERQHEEEVKEEDYFYQECYWGRFSRSVILPEEIDPEGATVNFKNGVLTVRLPKVNKKKTKKLKIKVD